MMDVLLGLTAQGSGVPQAGAWKLKLLVSYSLSEHAAAYHTMPLFPSTSVANLSDGLSHTLLAWLSRTTC